MRSLLCILAFIFASSADASDPVPQLAAQAEPLAMKYCAGCHNAQKTQGEFDLTATMREGAVLKRRQAWTDAAARLARHEMPPEDAPQPTAAEAERLQLWMQSRVQEIDAATPHQPGRVTMRRLNRIEYRNTVRDLFGIEFDLAWDPTRDFPADGAGYGFDNNGDVLSISPLHLEKYLSAAAQVLDRAIIVDGLEGPRTWSFAGEGLRVSSPSRPAGAFGMWPTTWAAEIDVREPGEYRVKTLIRCDSDSGQQAQMAIQADGRSPDKFTLKRQEKTLTAERKLRIAESGRHQVWVAYLHEQGRPVFEASDAENGAFAVESLEISGPYIDAAAIPPSHSRIFITMPSDQRSRAAAAEQVLATFLPRAFRRPVSSAETAKYVGLFVKTDRKDEPFTAAMLAPLKAVLVSPHFLYRVEVDHTAAGAAYPLGPYELASRLSYFLWSTMPDDTLFELAASGKLSEPQVLEAQTRRMLADPKSMAVSEHFTSQWLGIRGLDTFQPASSVGKLSTRLRTAMQQEPVLLFHEVLTTNRPITDLIDVDHTFANQELAKLYKLPPRAEHGDKTKQEDRDRILRYDLTADAKRGGLLTMAAVLTATSHPDRTSPVKRGKWVLDSLLGAPPPPPPPAVEALADTPEAQAKQTLRERLQAHRTAAACASCHKRMDPLGFAFENYDVLGRWRDKEGRLPIDASATLPEGRTIDGAAGLKTYLLAEKDAFARCLTEKLLTYALGRGVEAFDARTVDQIVRRAQANDYQLAEIVLGIVTSDAFRLRSLATSTGAAP